MSIVCWKLYTVKGRVAKYQFLAKIQPYERRGGAPVPSMGMPLPCTANLNCEKMYGDFVKCYDFAVHCFIIVALYCREG